MCPQKRVSSCKRVNRTHTGLALSSELMCVFACMSWHSRGQQKQHIYKEYVHLTTCEVHTAICCTWWHGMKEAAAVEVAGAACRYQAVDCWWYWGPLVLCGWSSRSKGKSLVYFCIAFSTRIAEQLFVASGSRQDIRVYIARIIRGAYGIVMNVASGLFSWNMAVALLTLSRTRKFPPVINRGHLSPSPICVVAFWLLLLSERSGRRMLPVERSALKMQTDGQTDRQTDELVSVYNWKNNNATLKLVFQLFTLYAYMLLYVVPWATQLGRAILVLCVLLSCT